jgi:hypothetical protein
MSDKPDFAALRAKRDASVLAIVAVVAKGLGTGQ